MIADIDKEFYEICHLIDENQVISFDIYDTALLRNVLYPTDVFDLVQLEINKLSCPITDFKQLRKNAEEKARSISKKQDVHYEEIYQVICDKIGKETASLLKDLELQIESRFTTCNPFIKKVYDYAISNNKIILFISDMYHDKSFLTRLLLDNGYTRFDNLYVSGMAGVSKATMQLYDYVKRDSKIAGSWLHIGDNRVSDYENALKSGLNAYYYKAIRERVTLRDKYSIEYSVMRAIQINYSETRNDLNYWQAFGINVISPLFFGFTNWLVKELKGKENVYFLSRDGYLPWILYNKFAKHDKSLPQARYLFASRKMYQLPALLYSDPDDAINLLVHLNENLGQNKKVEEIFDDLGIEVSNFSEILGKYGLKKDNQLLTVEDREKMKRLLIEIYPIITTNLENQKRLLVEYLKNNDIFEQSEIHVVDIGWRGSTHKAIKDITKIRTRGYYLGTAFNVYDDIRADVKSYAFHLGKPFHLMQVIMDNVMMFEFIFSAPHGSLVGFEDKSGNISPKLLNDQSNNNFIIEQIQTGVSNITNSYLNYLDYLNNIEAHDSLIDYLDFLEQKKYKDLLFFKDLSLSVGFGPLSDPLRFVTTVSIQDFLENRKDIERMAAKNLWKNAIIVEGSAEEFKRKRKRNFKNQGSLLTKDRLIKALKNPKKAFKYLRKIVQNK